MRAFEFLTEFVASTTDATSPSTAVQDKKDIMTLIGLKPSAEALLKVKELLGDVAVDDTALTDKPEQVTSTDNVEELPQEEPKIKTESVLSEDVMMLLVEKIKSLDPNNPKDAAKISQIETILEDDVIEPAVNNLIKPKFNSHQISIASDLKGALIAAPNPVLQKIEFLDKCTTGLVDLKATFASTKQGNIYQIVNNPVLNNIKNKIGSIEYGVGASRLGKMEVLLTLVGKGITKEGKGDLTLSDGTEVEIKASSTVPSKTKAETLETSGAVLYALAKDDKGENLYGSNIAAGKVWTKKMSKILPNPPLSLNTSSIIKIINPAIAGNPKKVQYTVDCIKEIYKNIFIKAPDSQINILDKIATPEGINPVTLIKIARMIEFEYYKKAVGHEAVLFCNATTGNYKYVEKAKDLGNEITTSSAKGNTFYSTGILDMKGTYANGLSKIFVS
jgi:hypothetical protein